MRIVRIDGVKRKPRIANRNGISRRVRRDSTRPRRLAINVESSNLAEGRRKPEQVYVARRQIFGSRQVPGRTGDRIGGRPIQLTNTAASTESAAQSSASAESPAKAATTPPASTGGRTPGGRCKKRARSLLSPARQPGGPFLCGPGGGPGRRAHAW